ncbi:MAG: MotA/TolQ/ExbB proton channel family protein, partial [Elusimicrobiota bacterium]
SRPTAVATSASDRPAITTSGPAPLVATAVGLLVALPCVFSYNALSKRVRDLIGETEALGRRLGASARAEAKR